MVASGTDVRVATGSPKITGRTGGKRCCRIAFGTGVILEDYVPRAGRF